MAKKQTYGNESITSLKGADRVRLRPAVIFGSDGIEGCQHSIFEILSNSIDEARQRALARRSPSPALWTTPSRWRTTAGASPWTTTTRSSATTGSWCSARCTPAASTTTLPAESYEYSLGLNGLGLCATQYASEYMDVDIRRDGCRYTLHFEQGENVGGLQKEPYAKKGTGSLITLEAGPAGVHRHRRARGVLPGYLKAPGRGQRRASPSYSEQRGGHGKFETTDFCYENGILDHARELVGEDALTPVQFWQSEKKVRDRADIAGCTT